MLYATDLCDSRCLHCHIWEKRPKQHLSYDEIVSVMNSKCVTRNTTVGMEGGEFLLHPEADKILQWFSKNHSKYDILANCLKPDKVIDAVHKYRPQKLYVSLDGGKETYKYMRGKDGYDSVIEVIKECRKTVPVSLMFTLTPYNSFKDLEYVIEISKEYDTDIRIGLYNNIDFFDTKDKAHQKEVEEKIKLSDINTDFGTSIPEAVKSTSENYDFLLLYQEWREGNLQMRCHSILDRLVIHPNGDVPICQNLNLKLGNIRKNSLDEIFNSAQTRGIHKEYTKSCNQCWINFHRKYDIVLLRSAEKLLPKGIIELSYGKYQWCDDKNMSYKRYLKSKMERR